MARPQAPDYAQRRDAIVSSAASVFARRGFRGASVAELAQACGMPRSLLYHYFPSKEDILYAVMASHIDQLDDDVREAMAEPTAEGRLRAVVRRFMEHYAGAADRQKVLLNELDSLPPERREAIVRQQRGIVDAVTGWLMGLDPGLDAVRGRARAMLLFGMINWTHTWFDPAGKLSPWDIAEMALDLVLRGGAAHDAALMRPTGGQTS